MAPSMSRRDGVPGSRPIGRVKNRAPFGLMAPATRERGQSSLPLFSDRVRPRSDARLRPPEHRVVKDEEQHGSDDGQEDRSPVEVVDAVADAKRNGEESADYGASD